MSSPRSETVARRYAAEFPRVEMVTIDTYVAELAPKNQRGRAFALNFTIQFAAVPVAAALALLLVRVKLCAKHTKDFIEIKWLAMKLESTKVWLWVIERRSLLRIT